MSSHHRLPFGGGTRQYIPRKQKCRIVICIKDVDVNSTDNYEQLSNICLPLKKPLLDLFTSQEMRVALFSLHFLEVFTNAYYT